jgi:IclR family KDG regulon transcriptional repressor
MRIQSVARSAAILQEFTVDTPLLGVAELSNRLGMERSTVQRLVSSLADAGLLDQDPISSKYRLGLWLSELAGTMLKSRSLPELVKPYLGYLTNLMGESTYLGVLDRLSVLEVEEIPSAHMIQHSGWIGRRLPLHCTSSGKAILSTMPTDELKETLASLDLQPFTSKTITDPEDLYQELVETRERGYAVDREEYENGTNAIAVALSAAGEAAPAAIGVVGPSFRFTEDRIAECADGLMALGVEIRRKFAHSLREWSAS